MLAFGFGRRANRNGLVLRAVPAVVARPIREARNPGRRGDSPMPESGPQGPRNPARTYPQIGHKAFDRDMPRAYKPRAVARLKAGPSIGCDARVLFDFVDLEGMRGRRALARFRCARAFCRFTQVLCESLEEPVLKLWVPGLGAGCSSFGAAAGVWARALGFEVNLRV